MPAMVKQQCTEGTRHTKSVLCRRGSLVGQLQIWNVLRDGVARGDAEALHVVDCLGELFLWGLDVVCELELNMFVVC